MIAWISAGFSVRPWILFLTASRLSGGVAGLTVTSVPTGSAKRRNAGSERPNSSGPTNASSSVIRSVASRTRELHRNSTRLKPRKTSGCSALEWREITTTFSRPVSRLTRRIFNCGRVVFGFMPSAMIGYQCENRVGTCGRDSMLLVAPPRRNSRQLEWP